MASNNEIRPPPSSGKWKRWARELREQLEIFETFDQTHPGKTLASVDRVRAAIWAYFHGEREAIARLRSWRLASIAWHVARDPSKADHAVRAAGKLFGRKMPEGTLALVRAAAKPGARGPKPAPERLAKRVYNVLAADAGDLLAVHADTSETMRGELGELIRASKP